MNGCTNGKRALPLPEVDENDHRPAKKRRTGKMKASTRETIDELVACSQVSTTSQRMKASRPSRPLPNRPARAPAPGPSSRPAALAATMSLPSLPFPSLLYPQASFMADGPSTMLDFAYLNEPGMSTGQSLARHSSLPNMASPMHFHHGRQLRRELEYTSIDQAYAARGAMTMHPADYPMQSNRAVSYSDTWPLSPGFQSNVMPPLPDATALKDWMY